MRLLLSMLLLLCGVSTLIANPQSRPAERLQTLSFEVHQQDYMLSTVLDITSGNFCLGSIVKSIFHIRTHYDLYNDKGQYEGVGVCRFLTLGAVYTWGTEIDVYDAAGVKIGFIDGQVATNAAAKFSIYNHTGKRVGIAYLDRTRSTFTIINPDNEQHHLVSLKRNFVQDIVDYWDVKVFAIDAIDLRLIKIFAAFAVDTQEKFKEDL